MKDKFYSFVFRENENLLEIRSFRDWSFAQARGQAEVYADKLRFSRGNGVTVTREYGRKYL